MAAASRRWLLNIIITSGFAALITGASSYLQQLAEGGRSHQKQQCDIASQLQDDTPSPYVSREMTHVSQLAAERLKQCLRE